MRRPFRNSQDFRGGGLVFRPWHRLLSIGSFWWAPAALLFLILLLLTCALVLLCSSIADAAFAHTWDSSGPSLRRLGAVAVVSGIAWLGIWTWRLAAAVVLEDVRTKIRETQGLPRGLRLMGLLCAEMQQHLPGSATGAQRHAFCWARFVFLLAHRGITDRPFDTLMASVGKGVVRRALTGRVFFFRTLPVIRMLACACYRARDARVMRRFLDLSGFHNTAGLVAAVGLCEDMPELGRWIDGLVSPAASISETMATLCLTENEMRTAVDLSGGTGVCRKAQDTWLLAFSGYFSRRR
jgi:hypothetical protein